MPSDQADNKDFPSFTYDGSTGAIYIRSRKYASKKGQAHRSRTLIKDIAIVDYDSDGEIIGIEILL